MRLLILVLTTISLLGCSAAQRPVTYDNTNIRLERIERNILERNAEIQDMKQSVEALSEKVDQISALRQNLTAEDEDYSNVISSDGNNVTAENSDKIVRVPVSAEQVQIVLKNAGYYNGAIDGKIGTKSINAIKAFQKDFNLKVDGIIGRQTWNEMKKYLE